MKGLSDVAGRLAWMAKRGIDRQVVGGWPDWFGYELPAAEGEAWCPAVQRRAACRRQGRAAFVPLASVPLQDGARAGAVLKAAVAAGFPGAMISTLPRGIGSVLDAPDLDPFWAAADETGALIHIHPSYDAGDARVNDYGLANGVGRISDAIVAVARLLCSGHVTRYRNARIFAPMGAAGLPFLIGRLQRNHKITPGIADPAEGLGLLYTDSILHDPRVLRFVVEMVGADRVMMGPTCRSRSATRIPRRSSARPAADRPGRVDHGGAGGKVVSAAVSDDGGAPVRRSLRLRHAPPTNTERFRWRKR